MIPAGQRVFVYRNIRRQDYSVRAVGGPNDGRVIARGEYVEVKEVESVLPSPAMPRGGARPGAGRPSAFPRGEPLHRRSVRLPAEVWSALDALAREWGTTDDGVVARLLRERAT